MTVRLKIVLFLFFGISFGFVQENIKVNLNFILEQGDRIPGFFGQDVGKRKELLEQCTVFSPLDYYHSHQPIEGFYGLSRKALVRTKWILTPLFAVVFWWVNSSVLVILFKDRNWRKWLAIAYALLFGLGFSIYVVGKFAGIPEATYAVSRKITGGLQSLIPLMIMVPARYLYLRMQSNQSL